MCTVDVYTDVYPDGRRSENQKPALCDRSRNGRLCNNPVVYNHPPRSVVNPTQRTGYPAQYHLGDPERSEVHHTISRDLTAGDGMRQASRLAELGQRLAFNTTDGSQSHTGRKRRRSGNDQDLDRFSNLAPRRRSDHQWIGGTRILNGPERNRQPRASYLPPYSGSLPIDKGSGGHTSDFVGPTRSTNSGDIPGEETVIRL